MGTPQGSVNGPLFFLIYINDVVEAITNAKVLLFAEDTTVFITGSDLNSMQTVMQNELDNLQQWFSCNKLSLNAEKTQCILFSKPTDERVLTVNLKLNDKHVKQYNFVKLLGIHLDRHLNWEPHVQALLREMSKSSYLIKGLLNILPTGVFKNAVFCKYTW